MLLNFLLDAASIFAGPIDPSPAFLRLLFMCILTHFTFFTLSNPRLDLDTGLGVLGLG